MKKEIGPKLALYPMPLVVIGVMNSDKPTWTLVGHTGIIGHDRVLVSLYQKHFINNLIKSEGKFSINIVNGSMVTSADYCGIASGATTDKSEVFSYTVSENGLPIIDDSPLVMECKVEDVLDLQGFDNFICSIINTTIEEDCLTEGKIDYGKVSPVLFEMPSYSYYGLGEYIGKGATFGRKYGKNN